MMPTTEKAMWRSRREEKEKSLIGREAQLRHSRRSDLGRDTTKQILPHTKLARERYYDEFGDAAWDEAQKADVAAEKRRKAIAQRRRRWEKALIAVDKDIETFRKQASGGTDAQRNASHRRIESAGRKRREIMFKLRSCAASVAEAASNQQKAVSASLPKSHARDNASRAAESKSNLLTAGKKITHSNDRARHRSYQEHPGASTRLISGFATASSSKARQKSAPFPSRFSRHATSMNHRPVRARSSHSDNSFLSKRTHYFDSSKHKKRTKSAPSSLMTHHAPLGHTAGGSREAAHFSQRNFSAPKEVQNTSAPKEGNARAHSVYSLPRRTSTNAYEKEVTSVVKERRAVDIPADTDMATDFRAYRQWPDGSGVLKKSQGCLLPANYQFSGISEFEWICPVRSCRMCFQSLKKLGFHFVSSHNSCLFNDNCDGTFTMIGRYTEYQAGNHRPALVKSKTPLPRDASPMMEARLPVTRTSFQQHMLFDANRKKAGLRTVPDSRKEKTVDEMMLDSSFPTLSSTGGQQSSEPSARSHTPPSLDAEQCSPEPDVSSFTNLNPSDETEIDGESWDHNQRPKNAKQAGAARPPRDATQENWRLLRNFLTGRQFYPPKRGHFAVLLSSPRSRGIVTRPGKRFIADQPKKVRLLMVHMTGEEPPMPCDSCALGRGPFKKCVAISKKAAGETTNGIVCCTNCASNGSRPRSCNVEELLSQQHAGQSGSQRKHCKEHPTPWPREQISLDISSEITKVDSRFTFAVYVLPLDGFLELDAAPPSVRLCSLTSGKALVELEGNSPFLIGPHGMIKLMPGMRAKVSNASEVDVVLHVSTVKS